MSLDHYVSQVHLRKFYAKSANFQKMFAYRKSDSAVFLCGSKDVCRFKEGSTNLFLTESRFLEEFLMKIEPDYDRACSSIAAGEFTFDDILVIAGFAAFIIGCSPTAMRLGEKQLKSQLDAQIVIMERKGFLNPPPSVFVGKSLTELLASGTLQINVDRKYPQAMGIADIVYMSNSLASFHWDILVNSRSEKSPFLSSDFPAAVERSNLNVPANRIIPLRPDLAVRIVPQIRPVSHYNMDSNFSYRIKQLSPSEVHKVNVDIVRSAENLIFASVKAKWVTQLLKKNAKFRIELDHMQFCTKTGWFFEDSLVVKETK